MVGNVPVSPSLDTQATLLKECIETGIQLLGAHDSQIIVFQSGKSKPKQLIQLNDVYAVVQNGLELKLESCPRVIKHHWNPFRKTDKVRHHPLSVNTSRLSHPAIRTNVNAQLTQSGSRTNHRPKNGMR